MYFMCQQTYKQSQWFAWSLVIINAYRLDYNFFFVYSHLPIRINKWHEVEETKKSNKWMKCVTLVICIKNNCQETSEEIYRSYTTFINIVLEIIFRTKFKTNGFSLPHCYSHRLFCKMQNCWCKVLLL